MIGFAVQIHWVAGEAKDQGSVIVAEEIEAHRTAAGRGRRKHNKKSQFELGADAYEHSPEESLDTTSVALDKAIDALEDLHAKFPKEHLYSRWEKMDVILRTIFHKIHIYNKFSVLDRNQSEEIYYDIIKDFNLFEHNIIESRHSATTSRGLSGSIDLIDQYKEPFLNLKSLCLNRLKEIFSAKPTLDELRVAREKYISAIVKRLRADLNRLSVDAESKKALWERITSELFPEIASEVNPTVPVSPPDGEQYVTHAREDEDIVGFIDRVYGKRGYLTGQFTRADLRKIDPSAVEALENWEKKTSTRPKRRAPLNLPTLKELNDRLLQADPATLTHAERLAQKRLIAMRKQGAKRITEKLQFTR